MAEVLDHLHHKEYTLIPLPLAVAIRDRLEVPVSLFNISILLLLLKPGRSIACAICEGLDSDNL